MTNFSFAWVSAFCEVALELLEPLLLVLPLLVLVSDCLVGNILLVPDSCLTFCDISESLIILLKSFVFLTPGFKNKYKNYNMDSPTQPVHKLESSWLGLIGRYFEFYLDNFRRRPPSQFTTNQSDLKCQFWLHLFRCLQRKMQFSWVNSLFSKFRVDLTLKYWIGSSFTMVNDGKKFVQRYEL